MSEGRNNLFPIFLKINKLECLIIGGGAVGLEKLQGLLKNEPEAKIKLVAKNISTEILQIAHCSKNVRLHKKAFEADDIDERIDWVIAATNDHNENSKIREAAKNKNLLVNVADTPGLCDFYLGSTVVKGNLKIGISTNGKSPTFAKRFRQFLEEMLPEETEELLLNLREIRNDLKGDFAHKVKELNQLTRVLLAEKQ